MAVKRHERTAARRMAVQLLYTCELQGQPIDVLLTEGRCLFAAVDPAEEEQPESLGTKAGSRGDQSIALSDYALMIARGVEERRDEIDRYLSATSENWKLARMPIVDRTILRLAAYEMLYVDEVPVSVSINEAVELAKVFGGEDESPRFVNGVLGRIAKQIEENQPSLNEAQTSESPVTTSDASVAKDAPVGNEA